MHLYKSKIDGCNVELEMSDNYNHWTLAVDPESRVTVTYKTKQGDKVLTWPQEVEDDLALNQVREALEQAVLWYGGEDARYFLKDLPNLNRLTKLTTYFASLGIAWLVCIPFALYRNSTGLAIALAGGLLALTSYWLWARYKYRNSSEYAYFRSLEEGTNEDQLRTHLIQDRLKRAMKKMNENNTRIEE